MPAAQLDITIPAGGTLEFTVEVVGGPETLAGYLGAMQIRELRDDEVVLAEVPPEGITIDVLNRQVTVRIASSLSETFVWRRGVYDLQVIGPSGDRWTLVEGRAFNKLAVTRED